MAPLGAIRTGAAAGGPCRLGGRLEERSMLTLAKLSLAILAAARTASKGDGDGSEVEGIEGIIQEFSSSSEDSPSIVERQGVPLGA